MTETLTIEIDHSHGAVLRVLGLIERRGWRIQAATLMPAGNSGQRLIVAVEPQPWSRPRLEVLRAQLNRLLCVRAIEGAEPGAPVFAGAPRPGFVGENAMGAA
ncbi:MAG: hypothetical protein KatS3mg119_1383 [Rhodothalassiaceae bacterium]|nr:MAG: hypothetical protein KatS3mg119_1383 [Rhodothalassiaceae bacterium]